MTLKEEIIQKYFSKQYTFEEITDYMRIKILKEYECRTDQFGFDWRLENIREPSTSVYCSCDPIITFHLPKSTNYNSNDFVKWFKDNGFELTEINHNRGYRIIVNTL